MGSNDGSWAERPPHRVWLDAFYIDKYEVTNHKYAEFLKATGHPRSAFWENDRYNSPDQPVVGVSWNDAVACCKWAGKRLPTEAEWEKAARGGADARRFPWGDEEPKGKTAFGQDMNTGRPAPVGKYQPNGYGLYDMEGTSGSGVPTGTIRTITEFPLSEIPGGRLVARIAWSAVAPGSAAAWSNFTTTSCAVPSGE